jgi:uncharacterized protein
MSPRPPALALTELELQELDRLLGELPPPLEPLDVTALDGYLCGVLLQPAAAATEAWLPGVFDVDGRTRPPATAEAGRIAALAARRHAELEAAIAGRQWFDPWVYELDDPGLPPGAAVLPWVAGFAAAMERFPALMALPDPALVEPLAVLYAAFDPADLEDAQELLAVIETLEPPATLAEAVEDLVRSVLLIADVSRPRARVAPGRPPNRHQRPQRPQRHQRPPRPR